MDGVLNQSSVTDSGSGGQDIVPAPPPSATVTAVAATTAATATAVAITTTTTTAAASGPNCATFGPSISQPGPSSVPAFGTGLPPTSTAAGNFGSALRPQDCLNNGFPLPSYPAPTDLGWSTASSSTAAIGNFPAGSFHNMNFGGPPRRQLICRWSIPRCLLLLCQLCNLGLSHLPPCIHIGSQPIWPPGA